MKPTRRDARAGAGAQVPAPARGATVWLGPVVLRLGGLFRLGAGLLRFGSGLILFGGGRFHETIADQVPEDGHGQGSHRCRAEYRRGAQRLGHESGHLAALPPCRWRWQSSPR